MIRIGISGWAYAEWRGTFYPKGLAHGRELEYASRQFSSIEINGTFYSLQRLETFERWYRETPRGFSFSVKGSQFITHRKRLKQVEEPLANFLGSGVLALREKLGPFIWQLPPNLQFNRQEMDVFLSLLPHSTRKAVWFAKQYGSRIANLIEFEDQIERPLRHCIEVRHESFMVPAFFELLRRHKIAFVFADTAGLWPYAEDLTADFIYIRLHGEKDIYVSGYTDEALTRWAKRIRRWSKGGQPCNASLITSKKDGFKNPKDVFVYFDNSMKAKAPIDAQRLCQKLAFP